MITKVNFSEKVSEELRIVVRMVIGIIVWLQWQAIVSELQR